MKCLICKEQIKKNESCDCWRKEEMKKYNKKEQKIFYEAKKQVFRSIEVLLRYTLRNSEEEIEMWDLFRKYEKDILEELNKFEKRK